MRSDRHCLMSDDVCMTLSIRLVSLQTNMRLVISICFGKFAYGDDDGNYDDDSDNIIIILMVIVMILSC